MIQQVMGAEKMTKTNRDIKVPYNEGLFPAQNYGGDDQHGDGKDQQPHGGPDMEAALVGDTGIGPSEGRHQT